MSVFFGVKPGSMVRNLKVHAINTEETIIIFFSFVAVLKYDLKINECMQAQKKHKLTTYVSSEAIAYNWINILSESLWVDLMTLLSNSGSAWRLSGVAFHPVKFPKQVDDFNFMGEHIKLLHHVPKNHNDVCTTAKKMRKSLSWAVSV